MPTALEALEQAQAAGTAKPADGTPPPTTTGDAPSTPDGTTAGSSPASPPAVPTLTLEEVRAHAVELEKNANAGEVEKLRTQNRELILGRFSEDMKPGITQLLDFASEASYVQTERAKLDAEKQGMARDRILAEFKDAGVTADHLKHCPDEASMKTMADSIKALGGKPPEDKGGEPGKPTENPPAMKEPPAATTTGGASQPGSVERFHRMGIEKGLSGLLGEFTYGQE